MRPDREAEMRRHERFGVKTVVLHEQANAGRILIEKFEQHAKAVGFAIVLLTASSGLTPRAIVPSR